MKKLILTAAILLCGFTAFAQTNLQIFYDFGKDRKIVTTTLEGFYGDNWGNTFFFIDYDYGTSRKAEFPDGTYFEIARCLNFWQNTALAPLSLQVEYNGGVYNKYGINHAVLLGLDYFIHSQDFRNTLNLKVLYKDIRNCVEQVPMQFTVVWGMQDLFGAPGLRFSGFADFWWQDHTLFTDAKGNAFATPQKSRIVFISEPQIWYNFGTEHFNIGAELELSYDFGTCKGFWARPCLGMKWVF